MKNNLDNLGHQPNNMNRPRTFSNPENWNSYNKPNVMAPNANHHGQRIYHPFSLMSNNRMFPNTGGVSATNHSISNACFPPQNVPLYPPHPYMFVNPDGPPLPLHPQQNFSMIASKVIDGRSVQDNNDKKMMEEKGNNKFNVTPKSSEGIACFEKGFKPDESVKSEDERNKAKAKIDEITVNDGENAKSNKVSSNQNTLSPKGKDKRSCSLDFDSEQAMNKHYKYLLPLSLSKYSEIYNRDGRIGIYTKEERKAIIARYREKRKRRVWKKKIRYNCRKNLADRRIRVKGRFVKLDADVEACINEDEIEEDAKEFQEGKKPRRYTIT